MAKVEFHQVDKILRTLPIGYYTGRDISCSLSTESPMSYYVPTEDTITISFEQVKNACNKVAPENIENMIRANLYHEISHAILTPDIDNYYVRNKDVFNIFEDERIERTLDGYYLDVDFKDSVLKMNGFDSVDDIKKLPIQTNMQKFYAAVRFGICTPQIQQEINDIIAFAQNEEIDQTKSSNNNYSVCRYADKINALYNKICGNPPPKDNEMQNGISKMGKGNGNQDTDQDVYGKSRAQSGQNQDQNQNGQGSDTDSEGEKGQTDQESEGENGKGQSKGKIKDIVTKAMTIPTQTDFVSEINNIFAQFKSRVQNNTGNACIGYSGIINPRLCDREDYRFFQKQTSKNGMNGFSKFHLNLWCDDSGSFSSSRNTANALIQALIIAEKNNPDFSFDLIRCGEGQEIMPKGKRYIEANQGTELTRDIFTQFPLMQKAGYVNYNILLYDGRAYSGDGDEFKAFNTNNTTIISDTDNERPIMSFCPNAKKIIVRGGYNELLPENVINTLKTALQ